MRVPGPYRGNLRTCRVVQVVDLVTVEAGRAPWASQPTRTFETLVSRPISRCTHSPRVCPPSWHRLCPLDMPLETKRSRHVAVAISELRVRRDIAAGPRQQRP